MKVAADFEHFRRYPTIGAISGVRYRTERAMQADLGL